MENEKKNTQAYLYFSNGNCFNKRLEYEEEKKKFEHHASKIKRDLAGT